MDLDTKIMIIITATALGLFMILIFTYGAIALTLDEGECHTSGNVTICAKVCDRINVSTCGDLIDDAIENYTGYLKDHCNTMDNVSSMMHGMEDHIIDFVNDTFGSLGHGFIDKCKAFEDDAKEWKGKFDEHDKRLSSLTNFEQTISDLNQSLKNCEHYKDTYYRDNMDKDEQLTNMQNTWYTSMIVVIVVIMGGYWYFFVRKKESKATDDEGILEPGEEM